MNNMDGFLRGLDQDRFDGWNPAGAIRLNDRFHETDLMKSDPSFVIPGAQLRVGNDGSSFGNAELAHLFLLR
jgi:hypothetical protein